MNSPLTYDGRPFPLRAAGLWGGLFLLLLAAKLCHLDILWAEEGYGSAAAVQILHGKMLYRDFWFDKPPLAALVYILWHGRAGLGLRLADALYALVCSAVAFRFAGRLWSKQEAAWAACLMAFFLVFDIPASVTTLGPDLLLVLPTLLALDCAARKQAFRAGLWCAVGLAVNAKSMLLLAVCVVWCWPAAAPLGLGFLAGGVPWIIWLVAAHALPDYWQQVWWFGSQYSRDTFVTDPWMEGTLRTLHWLGFHAALAAGAAVCLIQRRLWSSAGWMCWLAAAVIGVAAGERFFERYYFILLAPAVMLAAGGITLARKRWRLAICLLLMVPLVRFGPRYALLAADLLHGRRSAWSDVQLNEDSQDVARLIQSGRRPEDTLLVWGYRPDIFAYTQLPLAGKFLDSQLLTGVIADRHLTSAQVSFPILAAWNRQQMLGWRPTWIVDGLGPSNPALAISAYPALKVWLEDNYVRFEKTRDSVLYRVKSGQRSDLVDGPAHR